MIMFVINRKATDERPETPIFEDVKDLSITVDGKIATITKVAVGENTLMLETNFDEKLFTK